MGNHKIFCRKRTLVLFPGILRKAISTTDSHGKHGQKKYLSHATPQRTAKLTADGRRQKIGRHGRLFTPDFPAAAADASTAKKRQGNSISRSDRVSYPARSALHVTIWWDTNYRFQIFKKANSPRRTQRSQRTANDLKLNFFLRLKSNAKPHMLLYHIVIKKFNAVLRALRVLCGEKYFAIKKQISNDTCFILDFEFDPSISKDPVLKYAK